MRLRLIAPAMLLLAAAPLLADEPDAPRRLFGRSSLRRVAAEVPGTAEKLPAGNVAPPVVVPPPVVNGPIVNAPVYTPLAGTPVFDATDGAVVRPCQGDCPTGLLGEHRLRPERPRPAQECLGCSSLRCEYRFLFGGCRAFFGEGPFKPTFPENCPCSSK